MYNPNDEVNTIEHNSETDYFNILKQLYLAYRNPNVTDDELKKHVLDFIRNLHFTSSVKDAFVSSVIHYSQNILSIDQYENKTQAYLIGEMSYALYTLLRTYHNNIEDILLKRNTEKIYIALWAKIRVSYKNFIHKRVQLDNKIQYMIIPKITNKGKKKILDVIAYRPI